MHFVLQFFSIQSEYDILIPVVFLIPIRILYFQTYFSHSILLGDGLYIFSLLGVLLTFFLPFYALLPGNICHSFE